MRSVTNLTFKGITMKKAFLLSAAILLASSYSANASSFHFGFFAPAPVYTPAPIYVAPPRPIYVAEQHPMAYAYPRYNYEYNYWYYDEPKYKHNHGRKHNGHKRHERHGRYDD